MTLTIDPDHEPEQGPAKPHQCSDGPESHDWECSIEEGQFTVTSGCNLCDDGITNYAETEQLEMQPVKAELEIENMRSYDGDSWTVLRWTPTGLCDE